MTADGSQRLALFDLIQSCGAVEHISEAGAFFARVAELLKPGGYFVFTFEPVESALFYSARTSRVR